MMASRRMLSLASGVMLDATPAQTVRAAAGAGFEGVGIWVDPATWTTQTTREVREAVRDSGIQVLDAEVVWIRPGPGNPDHLRIIDIAAELGAANVLVVSSDPDSAATTGKFVELCEHARGMDLRVALEFGAFSDVRTVDAAAAILRQAAQPNQALLVDPLHLARSGGSVNRLRDLPTDWFSYAQFCDAPATGPSADDRAAIREEAVDGRSCPGEGALPLKDLLQVLPAGLPLSLEIRSRRLRDGYPDFLERARVVARLSRAWLERHDTAA